MEETTSHQLTRKDFMTDQDVRWCPGCGDYAILNFVQRILPELGIPREKMVFVSGIGCSSRFPYYVNTYGLHTIHGRAPTVATGIKAANPDLCVWIVTGDGDGLAIGGNHLIHVLRRNVDVKILLFNNRIYGLTKGQYSPTSQKGMRTKSTPNGSIDYSMNPISVALGSEATFVARTIDTNTKHLTYVLKRAAEHRGSAFVEIFQNCIVFNDGVFEDVTNRLTRENHSLFLEQGKPLIFGEEKDRGIRLKGLEPQVVRLGDNVSEKDLLIHDDQSLSSTYAFMLSRLDLPDFPVPLGVFRAISRPTYDEMLKEQVEAAKSKEKSNLMDLIEGTNTWMVT